MSEQAIFPGFDDGKEPDALRTIGEVAKALGIKQHVLRYWEEQFPMLRPVKRSGGRRYYRPKDVRTIVAIHRLVNAEGYTLRGARSVLEGRDDTPVGDEIAVSPAKLPSTEEHHPLNGDNAMLLTQLRTIRATLAAALAAD